MLDRFRSAACVAVLATLVSAPARAEADGGDTIVVTARYRAEDVQTVPVAASVVGRRCG